MGLLGGRGKSAGRFGGAGGDDWFATLAAARAVSRGDYGAAAQLLGQRRRARAERDQALAQAGEEAERRSRVAEALTALGYAKPEIAAMRPDDASRLMIEHFRDRPAGGGSDAAGQAGPFAASLHESRHGLAKAGPPPGTLAGGCRFRGGDPNDRRNWEPVGGLGGGGSGFPRFPQRPASLFNPAGAAQFREPGTITFTNRGTLAGGYKNPFEAQWRALERTEGGTDPSGAFRTSPDGAVGPGQVMPDTAPEAARLAGLEWDEQRYRNDRDYNVALGRAYYKQQLHEFGDPVTAAAAYNWGPTALRQAIRESKRTGVPLKTFLPGETLKHISRFVGYLEAG